MDKPEDSSNMFYLEILCEIVTAYVSNNSVSRQDLPKLISEVGNTLREKINSPTSNAQSVIVTGGKPAVTVKKSLSDENLICLNCGKSFVSLKRHIMSSHGFTPEEYRIHWRLKDDYPMVAPAYAARRSALALTIGLGRKKGTVVKKKKKAS